MSHEYIIQSVLFPSNRYSIEEAKTWLKKHKLKFNKVDVKSDKFSRWRQVNPEKLKKKGFDKYFTYKLKNKVEYIVAYKPIKNKI